MSKIKINLNFYWYLITRKTEIETYEAYVSLNMEMEEKECPLTVKRNVYISKINDFVKMF